MAGVELPLKEVLFRHEAPSDASPYTAFFDCPVRFGAGENALVFSSALLTMPLVQADENLHLAMREQARAAMEKAFSQSDLAHRPAPGADSPDAQVRSHAGACGISAWSVAAHAAAAPRRGLTPVSGGTGCGSKGHGGHLSARSDPECAGRVLAARLCRTQFIHAGVSGLVQLQSFGLAPGARRRASLNARKRPGDSVLLHAPDLL
jgi:hypothetical protein